MSRAVRPTLANREVICCSISWLGTRTVTAEPPYGEDDIKLVDPALIPGSVDPTTAVTAQVLTSAIAGTCRARTPVYDGRRRYDANMIALPARDLKPSNAAPFEGRAEGCRLTFERIAGFKPDRKRPPVVGVDGNHRWFVENDAFATHVHERVRRAEVDGHVPSDDGAKARKQGVCNHESASSRGERERVCGSGSRRLPPHGTEVYAGKVTKLQQSDGPCPSDYGT